jgi:C1A family cysteine protease
MLYDILTGRGGIEMPTLLGRCLGCLKDPEDERDFPLTRMTAAQRKKLPKKIDYTDRMSKVSDQGMEGTCVGFATVDGVKEYQERKEWRRDVQLSVRYVYANAKKIDGFPDVEGTTIRAAMKILKKKGVPPEKCWPYRPYQKDKPWKNANRLASKYKITRYVRLESLQEMKESLAVNGPFAAGVLVFDCWDRVKKSGRIPMPGKGDMCVGGHAICVVGYDDKKKLFKFKNSCGAEWGKKGYGYLSYAYMEEYMLDAWSAKDVLHRRKRRKKKKKKAKKKPKKKKPKKKRKRGKKKGPGKKTGKRKRKTGKKPKKKSKKGR